MNNKNRKSRIFTNNELDVMNRRLSGDFHDPSGLWSGRIRPKIEEFLSWDKKKLKKLLATTKTKYRPKSLKMEDSENQSL